MNTKDLLKYPRQDSVFGDKTASRAENESLLDDARTILLQPEQKSRSNAESPYKQAEIQDRRRLLPTPLAS